MNFRRRCDVKIFALLIIWCFGAHVRSAIAIQDAIIAVVNNEVITLQDLRQYIRETYLGLAGEGYDEKTLRQIMLDMEINGLDKLIEDRLILSKADQIGMTIPDKRVEDEINAVKGKYPSEEVFLQSLITHGATLNDLRGKIAEQLKKRFVIDHEIRSKIYVSPQEVTRYYKENQEKFMSGEYMMLDSLFLPFADDRDATFEQANAALVLIRSGEDFMEVTRRYSNAPSLGKVARGELVRSLEEKIFSMEIGEVSEPIEVPTGLYIFKLVGRQEERVAPLDEVKEDITNIIFNQKFRERYVKWMRDLKNEAYIEIKK
jgi:parvulin-like peptidyl-prolyl isomerase